MSGQGFIKKTTDSLISGISDPLLQMQTIYDYVRGNILYSERKRFTSMNELNKVIKAGKGDLSDIASILTLMMRNAGLNANLCVTSSRENGLPQQLYPSIKQFDYLLCSVKIDSTRYFLDATSRNRPWNLTPSFINDRPALLIGENYWQWEYIPATGKMRQAVKVTGVFEPDGKLLGDMTIMEDGYSAVITRNNYKSAGTSEQLIDHYDLNNNPDVKMVVTEVKNINDPDASLISSYHFTRESIGNDELVYFTPAFTKFLSENPFKSEERNYPVDFGYQQVYAYVAEFIIPDNYSIEELPQNVLTKLPDNLGEFKRLMQAEGNKISLVVNLNMRQSHFDIEYYPYLRDFFDQFISVNEDQIVLRKKM